MIQEEIRLPEEFGLQGRLASNFVQKASGYRSDIFLEMDEKIFNGKSIMSVLTMGALPSSLIILRIDGTDEKEALQGLTHLLMSS